MPTRTFFIFPALVLVLLVLACSDDEDPAAIDPDTTPPSVSSVVAIDVNHVEVTFSEHLQRSSAEDTDHYTIVETMPPATASAPDDTLAVTVVALKSDQRTVSITTSMDAAPYEIRIVGVKDASGNAIESAGVASFDGTTDADVTPPEIARRSPGPDATGVAKGVALEVTFSEQVSGGLLMTGTTWTWASGSVDFEGETVDLLHFQLIPAAPLLSGTRYTVAMTGVQDWEGNVMPDVSWSFTTSGTPDVTPPTIASSIPANLATDVDVDTDISITFSEPMDQDVSVGLYFFPFAGDWTGTWLDGGKTFIIEMNSPLADDQQYIMVFDQGLFDQTYARDLAGNRLAQSSVVFTTGNAMATGSIAGRLSGDPESDTAHNPAGAALFATPEFHGGLWGAAVAAENGTFNIRHLPDGNYYVRAYLESNGNPDDLDPGHGDAIGSFGVDVRGGDTHEDPISIVGGMPQTGRNFMLFDPSTVTGFVEYEGVDTGHHIVGVGLFKTDPFDPESPDYTTYTEWPDTYEFHFANYYSSLSSGTYYVGAFLDVNGNQLYDSGVDPVGYYGGATKTEIVIENGRDWNGLVIVIEDPVPGAEARY